MPLVLYTTDGSPPSRAVKMLIEILNLKVEERETRPMAGETRRPEFLDKNPAHTIPMLEDGNFALADSHAILTYLVTKYGADKKSVLYPNDMEIRATVDQRMYFDATVVFPNIRSMVMALVLQNTPVPTETQVAGVKEAYDILEKYLERNQFIAAEHLTIADVSLVASVSSLEGIVPIDDRPRLMEWLNKLKEFSWYKSANAPGVTMIVNFIKSQSEKLRQ